MEREERGREEEEEEEGREKFIKPVSPPPSKQ
jgi:hypothetical protein